MGYGDTYTKTPTYQPTKEDISEKQSLVSVLCDEAGYNREDLEDIELEAKIDLDYFAHRKRLNRLRLGEELEFPEPYSRDKILKVSKAIHSCYAFVKAQGNFEHAFTKVQREQYKKIKVKKETEYIIKRGIVLLKRPEKNLENLSQIDINKYISEISKKSNSPIQYIGSFNKQSKEAFVFNPTSGRIFVIATNICNIEVKEKTPKTKEYFKRFEQIIYDVLSQRKPAREEFSQSILYQLEIEYYGQINGFSAIDDVEDELINLVKNTIESIPKNYKPRSSRLTKFEWLVSNKKAE
jgi:hypothetical protein